MKTSFDNVINLINLSDSQKTILGNHAFNESILIKNVLESGSEKNKVDYYMMEGKAGTLIELAFTCLGEDEVNKRLETAKEIFKEFVGTKNPTIKFPI